MAKRTGLGRGLDSLISGGGAAKKAGGGQADAKKKTASAGKPTRKPARRPAEKSSLRKAAIKEKPGSGNSEPEAISQNPVGLFEIPVNRIEPNPHQPRKNFEEESLKELAESIRSEGLLQPVVVRRHGDRFQLIAGERRWRACQLLKLKQMPARIIEATEAATAVLSLIENLQRENLNPIEEAMGFASLMKDFDLTQERVAERVGRSRAAIANSLRLLQLHREIQGYLIKGHLSVGHAKVLLGLEDSDNRLFMARECIERGWSVRELERQVEKLKAADNRRPSRRSTSPAEESAIADLQKQLSSAFSTPVTLKHSPKKGRIIIEYFGNDDLQRIIEQMGLR